MEGSKTQGICAQAEQCVCVCVCVCVSMTLFYLISIFQTSQRTLCLNSPFSLSAVTQFSVCSTSNSFCILKAANCRPACVNGGVLYLGAEQNG